jgi:hypothetical protein
MAARSKISSAPNGENTSLAGTEAVPISGSQYTLISTIREYIRTATITFTNKTLTAPTVADFTNAAHDHQDADDGGTLAEAALALTDITTNNASTTKHGFLKKLSNSATEYMDGTGNWSAPAGSGGGRTLLATDSPTTNTVSFTSISGAYSKLVVEYVARSTRAAQTSDPMTISLNNDTTSTNYRLSAIRVTAAGTAAHFGQDGGQYTDPPAASSAAGSAEVGFVEIPFYAGTTFNKQVSIRYNNRRDTSSTHEIVSFVGMEWENTAAVTRIDFVLTNGNFVSGSTFNLYGEA